MAALNDKAPLRVIVCGDDGAARALVGRLARTDATTFIVAAMAEHGQDTERIATDAPAADVAVVVVAAGTGVTAQTRRHACLLALFGVRHVVLAVDGMHAAGDAQAVFDRIEADYRSFAARAGLRGIAALPVSGLRGDNVASASSRTPWYRGPTLLQQLDAVAAAERPRRDSALPGGDSAAAADRFQATIVWLHAAPLLRGRSYRLQHGSSTVGATVLPLKHRLNVDTLEHVAAERLEHGEIGVAELELDRPIAFDAGSDGGHASGAFTLIDTITQATVGAGMLNFALRRAGNIAWQALAIDKAARQRLAGHRSAVLWLTGLSGAGKSTIANLLEQRLHTRGVRTYLLDGDNVRHGLNKDLGFTAEDRVENIRRVAEVARLMIDAGIVVIAAFISPFRAERRMARELMGTGEFIEVFVDTPLAVAEQRDVKGLYGKARRGELKNFTGIDSPYEAPEHADVVLDTTALTAADAAELLVGKLNGLGILAPP